jgi:FMN phosphatase YigB (HAD superfamily)
MRALFHSLSEQSGVPVEVLIAEAKAVHERWVTVEYSLLVDELPALKQADGRRPSLVFDASLQAQNRARKRSTRLYPTVAPTLSEIRHRGVAVVAYSESLEFWTQRRVKRAGLDGLIDVLYTSDDHDVPTGFSLAAERTLPPGEYVFEWTQHRIVAPGLHKPDPAVLHQIIGESGLPRENVAYVGDSLARDIPMAQAAGVHDVWAAYGSRADSEDVSLLQSLTHWSRDAVSADLAAQTAAPTPAFVLDKEFGQLLTLFRFEGNAKAGTN